MKLESVSRKFDGFQSVTALSTTSIDIEEGEFVSVEGPSGSGKSTLLNILGLLDQPSSGIYEIDRIDTSNLTSGDRAGIRGRIIGFVFQSFHLLQYRTARENIELGLLYKGGTWAERRRGADLILEQVGLFDRRDAFPPTLSGGEKQRVAIARALIGKPRVLLCDEPTGSLDRQSSDNIMSIINQVNESGLTVVIVTHDPEVSKQATRHLRMVDGVISEAT